MNSIDTLTILFRHNRWANLRLVEQCAACVLVTGMITTRSAHR